MNAPATSRRRRLLAAVFAIPVAFSIIFFIANMYDEELDTHVQNIETLRDDVATLRALANDAEVGEHGVLLTGEESYRKTLEVATRSLQQFARVDTNPELKDLPPQLERNFRRFVRLVRDRVDMANRVLDIQTRLNYGAALDAAHNAGSEKLMNEIRLVSFSLTRDLNRFSNDRLEQDHRVSRFTFLLFIFGTLAMLVLMVWLYNSFLAHMEERDRANAALQRLNADLELRIEERTRELSEFNEELQQFAYVASHDLQEPLRTITSFTQLLASRYRGKLDADADEFMDYTVSSARRMTDLINGLLALVRLRKTGQQGAVVSLESLVRQAEISLQAAIRESGAHIETEGLPTLRVDSVQFTQVLQNLISNAIKYRREEPPLIRIRASRESTNWIIRVEDNGRGFDPQFADKIFGLFQRLQNREVSGTGMGLTIVKKIVERHGGRIWAESKEGVGSTFLLSLPASLELHTFNESETEPTALQFK